MQHNNDSNNSPDNFTEPEQYYKNYYISYS